MFSSFSDRMFALYADARKKLIASPVGLIACEKFVHDAIRDTLRESLAEFREDYNEASHMYPFWQNYPPADRGNSPKGDQFPWIEVGEHSVGCKLARLLSKKFDLREVGLPSGPDQRFMLRSPKIRALLGFTDAVMVLIDVKSVGPRDDVENTVLSPYQVSGDGVWEKPSGGIRNSVTVATGRRKSHPFHCALPPVYVTGSLCVAPSISAFVKPVYAMIPAAEKSAKTIGQPLSRIVIATLPNGLLLTENPHYLKDWPSLFHPGKDKKSVPECRLRARISFKVLNEIADWRVQTITAC
jgi:hypothetical protein